MLRHFREGEVNELHDREFIWLWNQQEESNVRKVTASLQILSKSWRQRIQKILHIDCKTKVVIMCRLFTEWTYWMHQWEVPDVTRYFIWRCMVQDFIQKLIQRTAKGNALLFFKLCSLRLQNVIGLSSIIWSEFSAYLHTYVPHYPFYQYWCIYTSAYFKKHSLACWINP